MIISILRDITSGSVYPPISIKIRLPVVGIVSFSVAAGLRQRNILRRSVISSQAAAVGGNSTCLKAGVLRAPRFDHVTPLLRKIPWLNAPERIKKCCPRAQIARDSAVVPSCTIQSADSEARKRILSASSTTVLIVRGPRLRTVGDRAFSVVGPCMCVMLCHIMTTFPSIHFLFFTIA